jgi:hypothetical protein
MAMLISLDLYAKLPDGSRGPRISSGYVRSLIGGRGEYIEIHPSQIIKEELEVEPGQEYRTRPEWKDKVFYGWLRTKAGHRKVYEQFRHVGYADYVPGLFYVSPDDVIFEGVLHRETSSQIAKKDDVPRINFDDEG